MTHYKPLYCSQIIVIDDDTVHYQLLQVQIEGTWDIYNTKYMCCRYTRILLHSTCHAAEAAVPMDVNPTRD